MSPVVQRAALVAIAALGFASCRRSPPPEEVVDGWTLARAALTSGEHCFAQRPEYCLTDPSFVDGAIKPRLEELYGGEMPPRKMHVDALIRYAAMRYKRETMKPENLAKVEELVKEHYANPKVIDAGEVVSVDMGAVPGMLQGHPSTLNLSILSSEVIDRGEWKRSELDRVMGDLVTKDPDKKVYRVAVLVPTEKGLASMSYRYFRSTKTVVINDTQQGLRTSKRLASDAALKDPATSLRFFDLTPCDAALLEPPPDQDPPKLCPPDIDPAAAQAAAQ
ncbi:MAG: hypothetical protein HOV80_16995 [Polyangiaceae bacterium]|nr:hypothetical protein [Polyangiaceae bacterium]